MVAICDPASTELPSERVVLWPGRVASRAQTGGLIEGIGTVGAGVVQSPLAAVMMLAAGRWGVA
jgi:hypothetical protein